MCSTIKQQSNVAATRAKQKARHSPACMRSAVRGGSGDRNFALALNLVFFVACSRRHASSTGTRAIERRGSRSASSTALAFFVVALRAARRCLCSVFERRAAVCVCSRPLVCMLALLVAVFRHLVCARECKQRINEGCKPTARQTCCFNDARFSSARRY